MTKDEQKAAAATAAVAHVETGMALGLGTGSTMAHALDALAGRIRDEGLAVRGVPTSQATADQAEALGIPLTTLDETPVLDLAIDGADEVDGSLSLVKGGGGALLREKIVASAARRRIIVVDAAKQVAHLGAFPLPIEVVPFGVTPLLHWLRSLGAEARIRESGSQPFLTDEGHWIVDASMREPITDPAALHARLVMQPAVVETGLFVGLCERLVVGSGDGVREVERQPPTT